MSRAEPIFVFATNESGHHENAMAQLAMTRYGAKRSTGRGLVGSSYAIPVRNRNNQIFSKERIVSEFDDFKEFARSHPELTFQLSRVGCDPEIGFSDRNVAPHFMDCPANVILPGVWERLRYPAHCVVGVIGSENFERREIVDWILSMTVDFLSPVKEFLVTDDAGVDFIAFQILSERGLPVRTVSVDWERYGARRAGAVRNREIAFAATHVLILDDGGNGKCEHMRKVAQMEKIQIYDARLTVDSAHSAAPSDPEFARQQLAEAKKRAARHSSRDAAH